ncbi:hypothetical protein HPB47_006740 [Ixodes persulcatus]|uniref:Uncharacterized protein n=1 Tax=Ixodes persulcatus TaxID=34615 RepID=A0AC60P9E0_IXOPE|nr:hypothetical protein HPB47_006740 [Ixodes persulcatus]
MGIKHKAKNNRRRGGAGIPEIDAAKETAKIQKQAKAARLPAEGPSSRAVCRRQVAAGLQLDSGEDEISLMGHMNFMKKEMRRTIVDEARVKLSMDRTFVARGLWQQLVSSRAADAQVSGRRETPCCVDPPRTSLVSHVGLTPDDRLCSDHFRDDDYERSPRALKSFGLPTKSIRLKPGVVPSIFSKKRKANPLSEPLEKRRKVSIHVPSDPGCIDQLALHCCCIPNHLGTNRQPQHAHRCRTVKHQLELFTAAAGKQLTIAGDGRADSPGHSAKYGTYTMLDVDSNKILHVETVQSNETGESYHKELEGLKRSLNIFETHCLVVGYPAIKKKLVAAGKSRHLEELSSCTKAVVNHLYWSAGTSPEDQNLILPKWKSLVAHVADVHSHRDPLYSECQHQELHKKWLEEGSPAHQKLREIVLSPHLLRDIPRLSTSAQTFATECFHSTLLQFAPKLMHYSFRSMEAMTYLAALHYNENAGRPQAVTKDGEFVWVIKFPKAKKGAVVAPRKTGCTYKYVGELMAAVLDLCKTMPS